MHRKHNLIHWITLLFLISITVIISACAKRDSARPMAETKRTASQAKGESITPDSSDPEQKSASDQPEGQGTLKLKFYDSPGGTAVYTDYQLYPAGSHDNESRLLWDGGQEAELELAAGTYDILCEWDTGQKWETNVEVMPDQTVSQDITLGTGLLKVRFRDAPGGTPVYTEYQLYPAGSHDNESRLLWDTVEEEEFMLLEGSYDLLCTTESGEKWIEDISVKMAETTEREVVVK